MDKRPIQVTGSSPESVIPSMKLPRHLLFACPVMLSLVLTGCSQQTGQINALKSQMETITAANKDKLTENQEMTQKLATVRRENGIAASKRNEFKTQAEKSGATAKLMTAYRADLEKALKDLTDATASYRSKYLAP